MSNANATTNALADPRGAPGTRAPRGSKFFHFHAVFGKNLKNNSNFGSWRTPLGKIVDPPLQRQLIVYFYFLDACKTDDGKTKCFIIHNKLHKALRKLLVRRVEQQEATRVLNIIEEAREGLNKYGAPHMRLAWKPVFENFEEVIKPPKIVKEWFDVDH